MNRLTAQHNEFRKRLQKRKRVIRFFQLALIFILIITWELASNFLLIDPLLFSSPSKIAQLFVVKISDLSLIPHLSLTLFETICSFLLGTALGVGIASVLSFHPDLADVSKPFLTVLNALPKVAVGPIILVIFGPTILAVVMMGVLITVVITALIVLNGFQQVDRNYLVVMQIFKSTRLQLYKHVLLPATWPTIVASLKVNIGLAWVGVIVGEFLVASKGLGYLIISGFQTFQFDLVYLSIMVILVCASVMYFSLEWVEGRYFAKNQRR